MESLLIWGLVLMAAGLLLVVAEIFLPTGGILGVIAAGLAISGVVCMFRVSTTWGAVSLLVLAVLAPMALTFALKIWPNTPLGRRIVGAPTEEETERLRKAEEEARMQREALIGAQGLVLVDLRPVGVIELNGKRYDAISEISFIPAGSPVKVSGVGGNELRVRPIV
jgi:membrane-bound ClpP family serine protease